MMRRKCPVYFTNYALLRDGPRNGVHKADQVRRERRKKAPQIDHFRPMLPSPYSISRSEASASIRMDELFTIYHLILIKTPIVFFLQIIDQFCDICSRSIDDWLFF
ncbi:hypothetical protein ES319_D05G401100v1 [Gossypium barbadense]|uniref:Uncharacterized protein n=2 Tax=Gossypium TaxID=3633 RepID=A0A5J5RVS1_GOSBA|nr:hypothetical protein ES319_D05G401100v1 [Gossypium barbadense]TYG71812.1 hypothetical protein ES288_D05G429000v1 [Gossypium darwinii]